jgi:carbamoyl-phosphate synthase small subunit
MIAYFVIDASIEIERFKRFSKPFFACRLFAMSTLVLADGSTFEGQSFGAEKEAEGEVVFNTGMVGYAESLTDPSYRGQILVFTYPLIGNYGIPSEELNEYGFSKHFESEDIHVRGVIVSQASEHFSHHAATQSLDQWLKKHNIPGITGVDTRALTKKLREHGVMLGRIDQDIGHRTSDIGSVEDPNQRNLVDEVSCKEVITYEPHPKSYVQSPMSIVAYDCGMKRNIIRSFLKRGVKVIRVPWNFDLASADFAYDGVFISNGPGDPKMCQETIKQIKWALEKDIPTFGICLGNQLLALAIGGDTSKMKYGHRGANQPCIEVDRGKRIVESKNGDLSTIHYPLSSRCIITSQNHGYAVSENLPSGWHVWYKNANDGTVEGIRHTSKPFFSVQFHPEATPGPEDANYLFDEFLSVLKKKSVRV